MNEKATSGSSQTPDQNASTSESGNASLQTQKEQPQPLDASTQEASASGFDRGRLKGREQERERIGAIMNDPAAQGRDSLARHLAFKTELDSQAVIDVLAASPIEATSTSGESQIIPEENTSANASVNNNDSGFLAAMNNTQNPNVGADQEESDDTDPFESVAQRIAGISTSSTVGGAA